MTCRTSGTTGMNRIGIFGGTFDPVHNGHVHAAECFRDECALDLVYVIPNAIPHLKQHRSAPAEDRLEMLRLAFAGKPGFQISDLELRRGGVSYTSDTVDALRALHPHAELYLFFGDDWLEGFPRWHNFPHLVQEVTVALANRSGRDVSAQVATLQTTYGVRMVPLAFHALEASSTERRQGNNDLCCEAVNRYIEERGLYT